MIKTPKEIAIAELEMKKTLHRRQFLKSFSGWSGAAMVGCSSAASVLQMMIHGAISKAYGETLATEPRTFLDIFINGGFPAQFLYLPLNPGGGSNYVHNTWNSTNWVSDQPVAGFVPVTTNGQTMHLPFIWGQNIPRASARGGGQVPVSSLLTNTMFARGFWNPSDGHEVGQVQVFRPNPTEPSISGMVADQVDASRIPIPAVSAGAGGYADFYSRTKGIKRVGLNGNPVSDLVSSFTSNAEMTAALAKKDQFSALFQEALTAVAQDARVLNGGSETILSTLSSAENLFRRNFGNLTDVFNNLKAKYAALITASTNMSELFSSAISPAAGHAYRNGNDSVNLYSVTNADLRTIITINSTVDRMAESFAVAEFLMMEGLSKAILIQLTTLLNVAMTKSSGTANAIIVDQHALGVGVSVVANNFYARSLTACLYELTSRLKETNKFNETVIKVGSEFTRSPRDDGTGGDHGWQGNCFMLLSGAIKKPAIVGNLSLNFYTRTQNIPSLAGTWGVGGTINHEGSNSTRLNMGHYASTVCTALKVPSPTPNFLGIVAESPTEGLVPLIGPGETRDD